MRWLRWILWILIVMPLMLASGAYLWLRTSLPQTTGTLVLDGPAAEIRITRDTAGVPHIAAASDRDWAEYLYYRSNPKGPHRERWFHTLGCRRWFNVARDTVTHEIRAVYKMGEMPPEGA